MDEYVQLLAQLATDPDSVSFDQIRMLRDRMPDTLSQQLLAPREHQAFAREYAAEHPFLASGLLAAAPIYQIAKAAGLMQGRSGADDPGMQIMSAYRGLGQGWSQAIRGR